MTGPINRATYFVPVSAEVLADAQPFGPFREPTAEEIEAGRQGRASRAHRAILVHRWHLAALAAAPEPVRTVLDLHGPETSYSGGLVCHGCEFDGSDAGPPDWPCQTYRAVVPWIDYEERP